MAYDDQAAFQRRLFQKVKTLTHKGFWSFMNYGHTNAYRLAERHLSEAMDIVLTPKKKAAVVAKALQIREEWDGINEITVKMDQMQEALDVAVQEEKL